MVQHRQIGVEAGLDAALHVLHALRPGALDGVGVYRRLHVLAFVGIPAALRLSGHILAGDRHIEVHQRVAVLHGRVGAVGHVDAHGPHGLRGVGGVAHGFADAFLQSVHIRADKDRLVHGLDVGILHLLAQRGVHGLAVYDGVAAGILGCITEQFLLDSRVAVRYLLQRTVADAVDGAADAVFVGDLHHLVHLVVGDVLDAAVAGLVVVVPSHQGRVTAVGAVLQQL